MDSRDRLEAILEALHHDEVFWFVMINTLLELWRITQVGRL